MICPSISLFIQELKREEIIRVHHSNKKRSQEMELKRDRRSPQADLKKSLIGTAALLGGWLITNRVITMFRERSLKRKVVLITGGSRGLGLLLARNLADEGARVVICGRSRLKLREAVDSISGDGTDKVKAIKCDITSRRQVQKMVRKIEEDLGPVDILINNAGTIQVGPQEVMDEDDYQKTMDIHFWGPFRLIQEVLPEMKRKGWGRIVNIVSIGGKVSVPHLLPYNTSKFALSGFSEGLAAEVGKYNIKVTTVYPGLMRTGSPRNVDVKGQHEKEYALFKLSDSLPVLSMEADRAAKKIIKALKRGSRTLTLTLPAKAAIAAHGLAPGATIGLFDAANRLLPESGDDTSTKKGHESKSKLSESFLTKMTDEAAAENLQK